LVTNEGTWLPEKAKAQKVVTNLDTWLPKKAKTGKIDHQ
jgi:hypothetical protein